MHWVREARPMLDRKRHLARAGAAIVAAIMENFFSLKICQQNFFFSLKKRFFVEKKIVDFCTQAKHAIRTAVSTMYYVSDTYFLHAVKHQSFLCLIFLL